MSDLPEVSFQRLSSMSGGKKDCINRSAEYQCPNLATQEVVCGHSHIRCCDDQRCMDRAAELARLGQSA